MLTHFQIFRKFEVQKMVLFLTRVKTVIVELDDEHERCSQEIEKIDSFLQGLQEYAVDVDKVEDDKVDELDYRLRFGKRVRTSEKPIMRTTRVAMNLKPNDIKYDSNTYQGHCQLIGNWLLTFIG